MKKRILSVPISLLLVLSMVLSLLPVPALAVDTTQPVNTANPFQDVKQGDWYYDAVQYARVNGFFNGTSETTFTPEGTMTRGMFVTVLGRMAGVDTSGYAGASAFTDVEPDAYYAPYVAWAARHQIAVGTGDGAFSPDKSIDRQQMTVFFVRYFDAFEVRCKTGAEVATAPADLDSVAPWAREAVLKLWKQGLLNGDGVNFDPEGNAARAQAAMICYRADEAVETWYSEPGVPSGRVRLDPASGLPYAEEGEPTATPEITGTSRVRRYSSGESTTRYYEVRFALGSGQDVDMELPAAATYPAGTSIRALPTPAKAGVIFLGWYYDEELKRGVETGDTVESNMTLYAKVAAGEEVSAVETPNYVTKTEVEAGTFPFGVRGASDVGNAFKFTHVTGGSINVDYTLSGETVSAKLEAGQTYRVELTDENAVFVLDGAEQSGSIRTLNILTAKAEAKNAQLNGDVKQIDVGDTSGLQSQVFDGLYQIDDSGESTQNTASGSFTYTGVTPLAAGDTVAVKSGDADLTDVTSTTGDVAYLRITSVSGDTCGYQMADVEDVLFMPDVLPIAVSAKTDGGSGTLTVSDETMRAAMLATEAKALDAGDFLGFYEDTGENGYTDEEISSYGKITKVEAIGDHYDITYTAASESDVEGALDVYYTRDQEIELTEEEKAQIEAEVKADVQESGYVEEAAVYLAAVMLESDDLETVPDMEEVAQLMDAIDTTTLSQGEVAHTLGGSKVEVEFDKKNINVKLGVNAALDHLQGKGFNVEVNIPFTVKIDGKVEIKVTATFEEEVILKQKISTKRHKIKFLKYDYSLNASFEVGNYTGIGFTAEIATSDGDDGDESMTKKLDEIMERMKDYHEAGGVTATDGTVDSLAEIYQDVMENANDAWIDIVDVKLFETNGSAFLHIFCWQVKGSFVVSANLCVSMGMSFDYTMQKQYNFSVRVKAKTSTNETIDIVEPQYNFDFYVVGTVGVRAGLRLEMYVGLFSLKVDKIGITAEVGAYARLWGYFFYHLNWTQSGGKNTSCAGAMLVEIGIYLDIKFVAQALSSKKLTWNPTIYAHEWPLWSAGEQKNVYAFHQTDDTDYTLQNAKTLALPGSTYTMKYMDLKSGETGTVSKDDGSESGFIITFTNPAFSYAASNNTVTVTPAAGSVVEETDMVITWKKAALSFTSQPIQKTIHLTWGDPEGLRYINFDTQGGSAVAQLSAGSGGAVIWPADPAKPGYDFGGWYTDGACTSAYTGSTTAMPTFPDGETGMTLYAKWTPATVSYRVEHYQQELNGAYTLYDVTSASGVAGDMTAATANSVPGFTAKPITQQTIAPDGSTVVPVYYDRNACTVTFELGYAEAAAITRTYRYGAALAAPQPIREGWMFNGWTVDGTKTALPEAVTESAAYTATWTRGDDNTVIFDSRGGSAVDAQRVATGERVAKPDDPVKDGSFFGGWYADSSFVVKWDFEKDTVTGFTTLYAKWIEDPVYLLTNVTFGYAYDAQRSPATPTQGQEIHLTSLAYPLTGYTTRGTTNEGQWRLSKVGAYGDIKDAVDTSASNLSAAVNDVVSGYGLTADDVIIYELKDGDAHIAYGVIVAYDMENGYVLFLGDTWNLTSAGYLLSKTARTGDFTAIAAAVATDF